MSLHFPLALGHPQALKQELQEIDPPEDLAEPVVSAPPHHLGPNADEMGDGENDHETGQVELNQESPPPATESFTNGFSNSDLEDLETIPEFMVPDDYAVSATFGETGDGGVDGVPDLELWQFFEPHSHFKKGLRPQRKHLGSLEIT